MRLVEAIIDANHRALAGDATAGLRPSEYADSLPLIALTCIDPRLNPLMPEVLGIEEKDFIWLRNSGNNIFEPLSTMTRTLALACAVKGGREIAIIGHTDCHVRKTSTAELTERFKALGIERARLPENLNEFFGLFASERQNVIRSADVVRSSPLIGPRIPVHGLLVDIQTGKLEWVVNGYDSLGRTSTASAASHLAQIGNWVQSAPLPIGEMKFPETKIGEFANQAERASQKIGEFATKIASSPLGHTRLGDLAAKVGHAAETLHESAAQVGDWVVKHATPAPTPTPTASPVPKSPPILPRVVPAARPPPPPTPASGGLKPIPVPPRIPTRPPPPRRPRND
jgi:carbonic anhydrase